MINSITPLLASFIGLLGYSDGYVIPRAEVVQNESTGMMYIVDGNGQYQPLSGPFGDDELDLDIMLFSLITIVFIYISICLVYITIRFVVRKILTRNANTALLQNGDEVRRTRRTIENLNARWPSALDDEDAVRDKLARLPPEEQFYYKQGEDYIRRNPPLIIPHALSSHDHVEDPVVDDTVREFISEEGAYAWEFQPDPNLPNDSIIVENKSEISFLNYNYEASVCTNLPIPRINRVYYCEFKIFELNTQDGSGHHLNDNELISCGLSTSPYPYFRLPGKHHHSIAYESTGARRFNDSFELEPKLATLFPRLEKGDVIGIGYRSNSGTVFFTRNGKKLKEDSVGGHVKGWKFKYVYPIVGANIPCKIHVNFGTYGFVYIEANVKKWGYAKSNGMKLPPPSYEEYGRDTLLESGCEDEVSDNESISSVNEGDVLDNRGELLPPPPGFEFSTSPNTHRNVGHEEISLNSLPVEPPTYSDDERNANPSPKVGNSKSPRKFNKRIQHLGKSQYDHFSGEDELGHEPLVDNDEFDDDDDDYEYEDIEFGEDETGNHDIEAEPRAEYREMIANGEPRSEGYGGYENINDNTVTNQFLQN
ncbi:protein ssh4 [Zygosaccharomyces mellis]|uniref:Protein ssh4 n=1 Tax=Zygosaccharomyces mellis TaxID=42258 RepID=A0A4C2E2M8_9SACH|nr:protein ssh4 [Zygosaccharomyces mellis]